MAQNYAATYAPIAEEAFALASLTDVFGAKYDWTGVKTVNVFTNTTVAPSAYVPSTGYGTPTLAANTVDDLVVAQDRKIPPTLIDRLLMDSTEGSISAAAWLGAEMRQQVVPDIDAYRFLALYTACPTGQISASAAITSANAYSTFLTGQSALDESKVPTVGRVAFCTPAYINSIKLDTNYVKASELAQNEIMFNGQVGAIDGVPVVKVPSSIMNATDHHIDFIIVHTDAVAAPMKLQEVDIFETVPGWSGSQIQGRYIHDCFLLDAKNAGIYIHVHA